MKKIIITVFLFCVLFSIGSKPVFADLFNTQYFTQKCSSDEIEVDCSYSTMYDSLEFDNCKNYRNNSEYRELVNSWKGDIKYCLKPKLNVTTVFYIIRNILPIILVTLILELPIFWLFLHKERKLFLAAIYANLISIPVFNLICDVTLKLIQKGDSNEFVELNYQSLRKFIVVVILEIFVFIFEAWFIKRKSKETKTSRIIISSFVANLISATVGTGIFYILPLLRF